MMVTPRILSNFSCSIAKLTGTFLVIRSYGNID
jgi:hypothetical protein